MVSRFSRWPPSRKSWRTERNDFSNFESLCRSGASHQVSAQSDRVWKEMLFEVFQDGRRGVHLGYRNGTLLAILNLCVAPMPQIKFRINLTYGLGGNII